MFMLCQVLVTSISVNGDSGQYLETSSLSAYSHDDIWSKLVHEATAIVLKGVGSFTHEMLNFIVGLRVLFPQRDC